MAFNSRLLPFLLAFGTNLALPAFSLDGESRSMVDTMNGWKAVEVITAGDRVLDSFDWTVPDKMDGIGAFLVDGGETLRIQVNHERDDASITEINIRKNKLKDVIKRKMRDEDHGHIKFVESARRAFDKWTEDGDKIDRDEMGWREDSKFCRFCSSQSYEANTFGDNRGFKDRLYITGEECNDGRLFVLDAATRELYQLSGVTGEWENGSGRGGMPYDSFENAALIDTGDTTHVAFVLSADGGSETLKIYIGKKGADSDGNHVGDSNFLARNGLLYGEWFYLGNLSGNSKTQTGGFVTSRSDAMRAEKFEDIDTNPNNPKQVVLAESESGVYILEFRIVIHEEKGLDNHQSKFSIRQVTDTDSRTYQYPDNVDWTRNNLIFVNRDHDDGGIWYMSPNGDGKTLVGRTIPEAESTGILDLSQMLDYPPASVLVTTNQGSPSSMTLLLSPRLTEVGNVEQNAEDEKLTSDGDDSNTDGFVNPDDSSSQGCPAPDGKDIQVIEAEDALFVDARVLALETGFCGSGYVDFAELSDSAGIVFEVDILEFAMYEVSIKYSNGAPMQRPASLVIDDMDVNEIFFFKTSGNSWSQWKTEAITLTFEEGAHSIELWWHHKSRRPNIDWMAITLIETFEEDREPGSDFSTESTTMGQEGAMFPAIGNLRPRSFTSP